VRNPTPGVVPASSNRAGAAKSCAVPARFRSSAKSAGMNPAARSKWRNPMRFTLSLLALVCLASIAVADDLRTLDNKVITGKVVTVDDKEVAIKTADGSVVTTRLDDVIALDLRPINGVSAGTTYTAIHLIDDTALLCEKVVIKGKTVYAKLLSGQDIAIPLASVASILRGAEDPNLKKAWSTLLTNKVKRDRVVLYRGGEINDLQGTIGDADADGKKIRFHTAEGDSLDVAIANLQGMIFYRPDGGGGANPICMVYDTVGNALAATKVASDGTKVVIVTTIDNVKIECDTSAIARFDYNMGKLAFLSDLVPTKVVESSGVGLIVTHRKDVNLDGEPIVLDRPYAKGLSLHSHTELEYDLKGKYKKFTAVLGVDSRIGSDSQPKVTIEVDGRAAFSEVITAKTVVPVSIDVSKANTIRIIVTSRNFLDLHDHVTIANPKLTQ
jgi:NPCBM/NEW2 domain